MKKHYSGQVHPIWSIYAHLKSRSVNQGDSISENQVIGLSGGGLNDPNHGTSTGAHLHFQIDKEIFLLLRIGQAEKQNLPTRILPTTLMIQLLLSQPSTSKSTTQTDQVIINSPDEFSTTRKVRPGILDGKNADWWLIADTPHGNYSFVLDNWVKSDEPIPLAQTQLFENRRIRGTGKMVSRMEKVPEHIGFILSLTRR